MTDKYLWLEPANEKEQQERSFASKTVWRETMARFYSQRLAMVGLIALLIIILLAVIVPIVSPYPFDEQNGMNRNASASWLHWFGTDKFGRDLFVRVWMGARISLSIGFVSAAVSVIIGVVYGGVAGYMGGYVDALFMRFADIVYSIPSMIYIILIMLLFGPTIKSILIGICISNWIGMAQIVRTQVMHLKKQDYVLASVTLGAKPLTIFFNDILRNAIGPLIVHVTVLVPQAIFMEAFLSFVGIGLSAPQASWGTLIQEAQTQMALYPMQMIDPLLVLCITMLALHVVGDGLQYAYNPRMIWEEHDESI